MKKLLNTLSLFIIIGFVIGIILVSVQIFKNGYLSYGMIRISGYLFQAILNRWIFGAFIASMIVIMIYSGLRWLIIPYFSQFLKFRIIDKKRFLFSMSLTLSISIIAIFGWILNRYYLPNRFRTISLITDFILLILSIAIGWFSYKKGWHILSQLFSYERIWFKIRKCGLFIWLLLIFINLTMIIERHFSKPETPNVILIVIDTLRADHLGCFGYERNTSSNIDQLSRESVFFKNAISAAPWTTPSFASMMTSQYPVKIGIGFDPIRFDEKLLTITEILKNNNYKTKGIISHTFVGSKLGFAEGFDSFDEENAPGLDHVTSPSITNKAISFLRKSAKKRFFLFLHYFDPHDEYFLHESYNYYPDYKGIIFSSQSRAEMMRISPYLSHEDVEQVKALYDSEITFTDEYIGKVFNELKRLGLYDESLIILTADHGEEFQERGERWIGHEKTLYKEQIHVPLMIKFPRNEEIKEIEDRVALLDLMPTLFDILNIKIPKQYQFEGKPIIFENLHNNRIIISETHRQASLRTIMHNGWKYILNLETKKEELYHITKDPWEHDNRIDINVEIRKKMASMLNQWFEEIKSKGISKKQKQVKFSKKEKKRLKSLGYM